MLNARVIQLFVAGILFMPVASAGHWLVYEASGSPFTSTPREDDGAVIRAPGNSLDGVANRVTAPGRAPGDGSLFLDALVGHGFAGTPSVYANQFTDVAAGRANLLIPGLHEVVAWYGWWNDLNGDGAIQDVNDGSCGGSCPEDEFAWRGAASGHSVTVVSLQPRSGISIDEVGLVDGTDPSQAHQSWIGDDVLDSYQGSLLRTDHTLVVAGAPVAVGGAIGYDLAHPDALVDVDRYEVLSQDASTLYTSAYDFGLTPVWALYEDPVAPTIDAILDATDGLYEEDVLESARAVTGIVANLLNPLPFQAMALGERTLVAPAPREPTTAFDDYGGRAFFGGVGDVRGSYNSYPGHADGYHYYLDVFATQHVCAAGNVPVPGTSTTLTAESLCADSLVIHSSFAPSRMEPSRAMGDSPSSQRTVLTFEAYSILWNDANGDGHVGYTCDTGDPVQFNQERGYCESMDMRPWHGYMDDEAVAVCDASSVTSATITLTPLGGPWPGVVVMRDNRVPNREVTEGAWEIRNDEAPITLRMASDCALDAHVESRDAILFPTGAGGISILTDLEAGLDEYLDLERGIRVLDERVRDVDVIIGAM